MRFRGLEHREHPFRYGMLATLPSVQVVAGRRAIRAQVRVCRRKGISHFRDYLGNLLALSYKRRCKATDDRFTPLDYTSCELISTVCVFFFLFL